MTDQPQGPGWWQAADLKWYPPELHADYEAPPAAAAERPQQPPQSQPPGDAPGPGWWQAADLKWYPPEQHADHEEPPPTDEQPQQPADLNLAATQRHPEAPVSQPRAAYQQPDDRHPATAAVVGAAGHPDPGCPVGGGRHRRSPLSSPGCSTRTRRPQTTLPTS